MSSIAAGEVDCITEAYQKVRSDSDDTAWLLLRYDDKNIVLESTGEDYNEMLSHFTNDERLYAYVRIETGDEMSKRAKFVLISWLGNEVSALKKARVSTDKAFVKEIVSAIAHEFLTSDKDDLKFDKVKAQVAKAGGANYGTGK